RGGGIDCPQMVRGVGLGAGDGTAGCWAQSRRGISRTAAQTAVRMVIRLVRTLLLLPSTGTAITGTAVFAGTTGSTHTTRILYWIFDDRRRFLAGWRRRRRI